jgi:hypothetical protein
MKNDIIIEFYLFRSCLPRIVFLFVCVCADTGVALVDNFTWSLSVDRRRATWFPPGDIALLSVQTWHIQQDMSLPEARNTHTQTSRTSLHRSIDYWFFWYNVASQPRRNDPELHCFPRDNTPGRLCGFLRSGCPYLFISPPSEEWLRDVSGPIIESSLLEAKEQTNM